MADEPNSPTAIPKCGTGGGGSGQEKRVCFICGSQTTQIINIHEPRAGPNIVDVISEKFKTRPQNDDKFLCYSCNNWLINWHSLQAKGNEGISSAAGSSSTARSSSLRNSSRKHPFVVDDNHLVFHDDLNDLTITASAAPIGCAVPDTPFTNDRGISGNTNDTVKWRHEEPGVPTSETAAAIYAMRRRLKNYIYLNKKVHHPKKTTKKRTMSNTSMKRRQSLHEDGDEDMLLNRAPSYHFSSPFRGQKPCDLIYNRTPCVLLLRRQRRESARCRLCNRPLRTLRQKQFACRGSTRHRRSLGRFGRASIRVCQRCKVKLHARFSGSAIITSPNSQQRANGSSQNKTATFAGAQCRLNAVASSNACIANKLKMLGTTLSYESDECRRTDVKQIPLDDDRACYQSQPIQLYQHCLFKEDHLDHTQEDIGESERNDGTSPIATIPKTQGNEIVLTFNTVVTEVFPIKLFHMDDHAANCGSSIRRLSHVSNTGRTHSLSLPYGGDEGSDSDSFDSADEEVAHCTAAAAARAREKHINEIIKYVPKSLTITLA